MSGSRASRWVDNLRNVASVPLLQFLVMAPSIEARRGSNLECGRHGVRRGPIV